MTAQDTFKRLLAEELRADFKARAFRQKGLTFCRTVEDNYGIVQFQKSRSATAASLDFTINLGVFSGTAEGPAASVPGCDTESRPCRKGSHAVGQR